MSKQMDVGRSWRTIAKHDLMNRLVGQEIGATPYVGRGRITRNCLLDLNAGDAAVLDNEWHRTSSPGMLAYHASKAEHAVLIVLHEIDSTVHTRLLDNLAEQLPALGYKRHADIVWSIGDRVTLIALNKDGQDADVGFLQPSDAALVLHDPNAITDWSMRPTMAQEIQDRGVWCARSLSTIGSNACGVKRSIDYDDRVEWFHRVDYQQMALPEYRDLLLAAIDGDSHQWAYLICTAKEWRERTDREVQRCFRKIDRTVTAAWCRSEPAKFGEIKRRLFLTNAERDAEDNPTLPIEDL